MAIRDELSSECCDRLVSHDEAFQWFDRLLTRCRERGWLKARRRQRTDSTHVLAAIRNVRRLEGVGEMLRHTLDILALLAPERPRLPQRRRPGSAMYQLTSAWALPLQTTTSRCSMPSRI